MIIKNIILYLKYQINNDILNLLDDKPHQFETKESAIKHLEDLLNR